MTGYTPKPGPPPSLDVEIVQPSTSDNPIAVDNGMIHVEVRATAGMATKVNAESYLDGAAAPAEPSTDLPPHPTIADLYVGDVPAPCSLQAPFALFRIRAVGEFPNPSGDPMDPPVKVPDDAGVFEGKCVEP